MSNVVSLQSVIDARRATEIKTAREAGRKARESADLAAIVAPVAHSPLAAAFVAAIVSADQAERRKADENRPMPAYCDPDNERRGAKHEATKSLSTVEIAKRMRADIKEAINAGRLPKGLKVSVRSDSFSGGCSIDIRVTALPEDFRIVAPLYLQWAIDNPQEYRYGRAPFPHHETVTPECADLLAKLKAIHGSYNRDNSDAMSDYFDVRYYGDAGLDWQLRDAMQRAEGLPKQ